MTGKASRRKGHDFERKVANALRPIFPGAKRGQQSRDGSDAPDVEVPFLWVETKKGKKHNIRAAIEQSESATDGRFPIAIIKDDRKPPIVVMRWPFFWGLIASIQAVKVWWHVAGYEEKCKEEHKI